MPSAQEIIARCDRINRIEGRALTDAEVIELQRAVHSDLARQARRNRAPSQKPRWTAAEDETVRRALSAGQSLTQAAALVRRSYSAVRCRVWNMPDPPTITLSRRNRNPAAGQAAD